MVMATEVRYPPRINTTNKIFIKKIVTPTSFDPSLVCNRLQPIVHTHPSHSLFTIFALTYAETSAFGSKYPRYSKQLDYDTSLVIPLKFYLWSRTVYNRNLLHLCEWSCPVRDLRVTRRRVTHHECNSKWSR